MRDLPENDLKRLLAEEPFVRSLAKQLVVEDADEVVQQTYLRAMERGGRDVVEPRSWLRRVVRNVAANLRRSDRRRDAHQREAAVEALVPSAAELAEREEHRRTLVAAVNRLSPTLRTVVMLRWFEGLPPREIARLLSVPVATVSTQLQRAHERLRHLLDSEHGGDRHAWLVPLVPFAARPSVADLPMTPVLPAMTSGAIVMTIKSKVMLAAAVVLAVGALVWSAANAEPLVAPLTANNDGGVDPSVAGSGRLVAADASAEESVERQAVEAEAPDLVVATTGSVLAHLRFEEDKSPAANRMVSLRPRGTDARFGGMRKRTDETGTARFDDVAPGSFYVGAVNRGGAPVEVVAGEVAEVDLVVDVGLSLTGIVVDEHKRPVAGAWIETTMMALADSFPEVMAVSGVDGRFTIRSAHQWCLVGARAEGYTASKVRFLMGQERGSAEVELVLGADGGSVGGTVVDSHGNPVVNAAVIVGEGELSGIAGQDHIPPFAALARTDEEGKFLAIGIAPGKQLVQVRAEGLAPWTGDCAVVAHTTESMAITLANGATITGVVYDDAGEVVKDARIHVGDWGDVDFVRTRSKADGRFVLSGLAGGEWTVAASHDSRGKGEATVVTKAGETFVATLNLTLGFRLRGRIVDAGGNPVAKAHCECMADRATGEPWFAHPKTDAQGRFVAANCPEKGVVTIRVSARGFEELYESGIQPKAGEVVLKLKRSAPKTARMIVTVLTADGLPAKNTTVYASRPQGRSQGLHITDDHGRVELGPYAPGEWVVHVQHRDHPSYRSDVRTLKDHETLDLGTITLLRGGTAVVRQLGDGKVKVRLIATDVAMRSSVGFHEDRGLRRSSMLEAGDYLVLVSGKGVAAQAVPFSIRAGETTQVDVEVHKGVEQAFSVTWNNASKAPGLSLLVKRGETVVARVWTSLGEGGVAAGSVWLLPGDYTIRSGLAEHEGSVAFSVGATAGPPVDVSLR